jgi:hypothetical protein
MLIMGSAASVVLVALPFLFRSQTVTYSMERERQPPFDCVQGIQEYCCPGVEPLHPMQRSTSPSDAGRSRVRKDQNARLHVSSHFLVDCYVYMRFPSLLLALTAGQGSESDGIGVSVF